MHGRAARDAAATALTAATRRRRYCARPLPCCELLPEPPAVLPQDEGEEVSLELPAPAKGSVQLPFPSPPPLKAVLLDVELPISLVRLGCPVFE